MAIFLAFRNLFRNFRRTLAILLTIALGASALFAFQGFIKGILMQFREDTIHSQYGNGQINMKGYRDSAYKEPWKHWIRNSGQLTQFFKRQEGVEHVFPRVTFGALLSNGGNTANGMGQGVDAREEATFFHNLNIVKGVTLTNQPNGIILGQGLAKGLGAKVGDRISAKVLNHKGRMGQGQFTVVGIFHTGVVEFDNNVFRIQLREAQKMLNTSDVESISLGLKNYTDWDRIAKEIEKHNPQLEATSFAELDKVYYQNSVDWLNAQFKIVQIIILGIVLLGIFNTVSASILERKQEIGNLRANGESIFDVMKLILYEGFLLGVLGSTIGLSLTYFIVMKFLDKQILMPAGPGSTRQFLLTFHFDWDMVFYTAALNIAAAILASYIAGIKVARMPIAQALRSY